MVIAITGDPLGEPEIVTFQSSDILSSSTGTDTLVIDGHNDPVELGPELADLVALSGVSIIRFADNNAVPLSTRLGENGYNLELTNRPVGDNDFFIWPMIINDNDSANDLPNGGDTVGSVRESGVTINARHLNSLNIFFYDGEEGLSRTTDRFIFSDASLTDDQIIDGGAVDNLSNTASANLDVLEIRNDALITSGDLANIENVGIIAGTNDQTFQQIFNLDLTDIIIDQLVDSYHTASIAEPEAVTVRMNNVADLPAPAAPAILNLDLSSLTKQSTVNVELDGGFFAQDAIRLSPNSRVEITNFKTSIVDSGSHDVIHLSQSQFAVSPVDLGSNNTLASEDFLSSAGPVSPVNDNSNEAIIFDQSNGNLYYNVDGSSTGGLTLIATLVGVNDLTESDFSVLA
ncbi:MAG: hypothetical protein IPJ05_10410 [Nitrosomonas sp.]|nr:hypothetical protein [Nitrosomonas sp.]